MILRPKLLAVGETRVGTGYARVLDELVSRLSPHFQIERLAIGTRPIGSEGEPHLHFLDESSRSAECNGLVRVVKSAKPDLVLINFDIGVLYRYLPVLKVLREMARIVVYTPLDGPTLDPGIAAALLNTHHVVFYTREQADVFRQSVLHECTAIREHASLPKVSVIGLGIDTARFRPHSSRLQQGALLNRADARARGFGAHLPADAFIVLNANRNVLRKRIDLTVEGFARFAVGKPRTAMLWLHMAPHGGRGWDLRKLIDDPRLDGRVILTGDTSPTTPLPLSELSRIYNACDVGINTSVGEGWGLVPFEHAATGAAQVLPYHTALPHIWGNSAVWIKTYRPVVTSAGNQEAIVDVDDVATKLEELYEKRAWLMQMSEAALQHTKKSQFRWDVAAEQWHALLRGALLSATTFAG